MKKYVTNRVLSILIVICLLFSLIGCGNNVTMPTLSDPNEQILGELIEIENKIDEEYLFEYITTEIYLTEIVIAEDKISELLLEEETIEEVLLCKSIYVPQDRIEEFAENSQTSVLFGDSVNLKAVLTKYAIGAGIILTLVVLSKSGVPEPVVSMAIAGAETAIQGANNGAAIGSLYGGLSGATDVIDESGRTSAVIGFATATAGLLISIVSLVGAIPSGGSTSISAAAGIKLIVAGIFTASAAIGTVSAAIDCVQTFQSTECTDIDWERIDWDLVGQSAIEKSIENRADGYMWGALVGGVCGGISGYEKYEKFTAPHTSKDFRIKHTPVNDGSWTGARGESTFIRDEPITLSDGRKVSSIYYENGVPDFSPYEVVKVKIKGMTNIREDNFAEANKICAEYWSKIKYGGKSWTARDVKNYMSQNKLTWHEMSNMESMQMVPTEINETFLHCGGVAEYNAMIGEQW